MGVGSPGPLPAMRPRAHAPGRRGPGATWCGRGCAAPTQRVGSCTGRERPHRHAVARARGGAVDIGEGLDLAGAPELEAIARRRSEIGLRHDRLWALLDAGQALALAGGEGRRAAEVLRQAGAEAAAMGAVTEQPHRTSRSAGRRAAVPGVTDIGWLASSAERTPQKSWRACRPAAQISRLTPRETPSGTCVGTLPWTRMDRSTGCPGFRPTPLVAAVGVAPAAGQGRWADLADHDEPCRLEARRWRPATTPLQASVDIGD